MTYIFVGLVGKTESGELAQVNIYADPDDEQTTHVQLLDQARQIAGSLGLDTKGFLLPSAGSTNVAPVETQVCQIQTVVFREQENTREDGTKTVTPALVVYEPFKTSSKGVVYNKYAKTTIYLNTPEQVEECNEWLRALGVDKKVEELPLYNGQGAPMRDHNSAKKYEFVLPKFGKIEVKPVEFLKEDGSKGTKYRFVKFVT
jgi:hypothetical protein